MNFLKDNTWISGDVFENNHFYYAKWPKEMTANLFIQIALGITKELDFHFNFKRGKGWKCQLKMWSMFWITEQKCIHLCTITFKEKYQYF
jgi:hypothetical protein